jgi:hypothetical protein
VILFDLPFADAVEYADLIVADRDSQMRFDGAIHGVDIKASGTSRATGTLRNSHTRMASRYKQGR